MHHQGPCSDGGAGRRREALEGGQWAAAAAGRGGLSIGALFMTQSITLCSSGTNLASREHRIARSRGATDATRQEYGKQRTGRRGLHCMNCSTSMEQWS